ncbi:uncharacterized protein [Triticum aestivum]|uniref:uncharacterized protein isoform X2 n=1 Tax=Triticum aestivum TaxID=4565 RepID=UPI001D008EAD|nr:uncharacterized protein LOC123188805 isoform X2 [Triticum aestivum]
MGSRIATATALDLHRHNRQRLPGPFSRKDAVPLHGRQAMQPDGARKRAATWSSNRSWLRATGPTRHRPVFREWIQRAEPADARCGHSILGMRRGVSGALAAPGRTSASARDATESPALSLLAALSLRPSCSCPALHSLQQRIALPSPRNTLPPPCLPSSIGHPRLGHKRPALPFSWPVHTPKPFHASRPRCRRHANLKEGTYNCKSYYKVQTSVLEQGLRYGAVVEIGICRWRQRGGGNFNDDVWWLRRWCV